MAKLYGIGASVVIIGALFKIQHIQGGGTNDITWTGSGICHFLLLSF